MGKEWHWAGKSSRRGGEAGAGGGAADTGTPSGCMCAVFQFFDFHPFHIPMQQQQASLKPASCEPEVHNVPKGAEAPRNSLESEDGTVSFISKEENLKLPKSMQIKTRGSARARTGNYANDLSSEISCSPGTKTPTLVARLMGLDLLPDAPSPSSSSSLSTPNPPGNPHLPRLRPKQQIQARPRNRFTDSDIAVSHSLPETPRISAVRRSDVDHHRLSLQINKENMDLGEDLELPRFSFSKRKFEEHSRIPSHYARQIVKQVKESVTRKVGLDITNTVKNREQVRDDQFVGQSRVKKSPKTSLNVLDETSPGKHSNPSCSPRLRFIDTKPKPVSTITSPLTPKDQNSHPVKPPSPPPVKMQPQLTKVFTKPKPQAFQEHELQKQKTVPKRKKVANEKFSSRLKKPPQKSDIIRNKQEVSFVHPPSPTKPNDNKSTKCKKSHPLPSNLLHLNTVPNLAVTKIPQKQSQVSDTQESKRSSQLSSCSRQEYKHEATCTLAARGSNDEDKFNGVSSTGADDGPEFQYISGIISRTGIVIDKGTTTVSFTKGSSPTHHLDASNFHQFEQDPTFMPTVSSTNNNQDCIFTPNYQMDLRCNRRLLFDLVNDILGEILKHNCNGIKGSSQLIETVWKKVQSFPCAKCEFLEDINELIELEDLPKMKLQGAEAMEEEVKGIVAEIEGKIWDTLVHETVVMAYGGFARKGRRRLDRSVSVVERARRREKGSLG